VKKFKLFIIGFALMAFVAIATKVSDNYFEIGKNLDIFATLYKELNIYYVDETNPGELMKTGIDAMLRSLDPYTVYYPESDIEDYRFMTTGEYGGIGCLIRQQGENVIVAEPYEGFPAHKAGLMAGDILLTIDDQQITGKSTGDVSKLLKGQAKTTVALEVERNGEKLKVELTRETVKIKDVSHAVIIDSAAHIGYIRLNSFTETASRELADAFKELKSKHGMEKLIFDLRGNGGGLLNEAVNIVNFFVEQGKEVVNTKGKLKEWEKTHRALNTPMDLTIPIVVLIDEGSASASEIVSGALQDYDRAVLLGALSFGKGLVQQTKPLSYNSQLKLTVAKYYIPSGRCIQKLDYAHKQNGRATEIPDSLRSVFHTAGGRPVKDGKGIQPDIEVALPDAANITIALLQKNLIFDYATVFRRQNPNIGSPESFKLNDAQYQDFVKFLSDKDYSYETESENILSNFEKAAVEENYFDEVTDTYKLLKDKIEARKARDLDQHQKEIRELLENEIVSRYYFQSGRTINSLKYDIRVQKAVDILNNTQEYNDIIVGKSGINKK
jgi:carboxyl-terminal processing protease